MTTEPVNVDHNTVLLIEDDDALRKILHRQLLARRIEVVEASSVGEALAMIAKRPPQKAIVDLSLSDGSGLEICEALQANSPNSRYVVNTGFGDIKTAVAAVKLGAVDYFIKPSSVDDILGALFPEATRNAHAAVDIMSAESVRWDHIMSTYALYDRNVSETARRLQMHRRTLQRMLSRGAPAESLDVRLV